jgi:DNA-binding YbaB/EbfC family protein
MSKKPRKKKYQGQKQSIDSLGSLQLPGGSGKFDLSLVLEQARQIQEQMAKAQAELREQLVEGSAGGGMVRVSMRGDHRITAIKIAPECIDPDDVEMLEDLIVAAANDALSKLEELAMGAAGPLASLGSIPGLETIPGLESITGADLPRSLIDPRDGD